MNVEQKLVQATQANEQLRQAYRNEATAKFDATERLRKMREALEKLRDKIRPFDNGRCEGDYFADELQGVLDEFA